MNQSTYPQKSRRDSVAENGQNSVKGQNQSHYLHIYPNLDSKNRNLNDSFVSPNDQSLNSYQKESKINSTTNDSSIQLPPVSRSHNYRKIKSKGRNKRKQVQNTQNDYKPHQGGRILKIHDSKDNKSKQNYDSSCKQDKSYMISQSPNFIREKSGYEKPRQVFGKFSDTLIKNESQVNKRNNSIIQQRPINMHTANTDPISPFTKQNYNSKTFDLGNSGIQKNSTRKGLKNSQYLDSCSELYASSDAISQNSSELENSNFNQIEKFNDIEEKNSDTERSDINQNKGEVNKKQNEINKQQQNYIRVRKIATKGSSKKIFNLNGSSPGESPNRTRNIDSKSELKHLRYDSDNGSTDSTSMCSPHPNLKKLDICSPLELSPPLSRAKEEKLGGKNGMYNRNHQILNPEARLRELLGQNDIEVFDLHFCLQRLNKQYGFSYQTSDFQVYQRIERRQGGDSKDYTQNLPENGESQEVIHIKDQGPLTPDLSNLTPEQDLLFKPVHIDQNLIKNPENLPQVTAKTWSIFDGSKGVPLFTKSPEIQCEIASLTKIMTAYLVCTIIDEWGFDPSKLYCRVSKRASHIGGTSAVLREGQRFSVLDLLHGVMLPSGNDASVVLAEHFGRYFLLEKAKANYSTIRGVCEMDPFSPIDGKIFQKKFIKRMNQMAKLLKMRNTQYNNPHGLSDKANRSNVNDIQKLTFIALKNPLFKKIVSTQAYRTDKVFQINVNTSETKLVVYQWYNLNRLLSNKGFLGVKTGYTPNAGSCLTTHYVNPKKGTNLLITVLCAKTNELRFIESAKLCYWAENKLEQEKQLNQTFQQQSNVI